MGQTDFIPRADAAFTVFFRNIAGYCGERLVAWGHIPPEDFGALAGAFDEWQQAYEATRAPHIPQLTAEMRRARRASERALRAFINRFLRWPPVTDLDRDKMGIRNHHTPHTSHGAPASAPEIEFALSVIRQIAIRYRDFGAAGWAKPGHARLIEIRWAILDAAPDTVRALINVELDTATPCVLEFAEADRGRRIFAAARWVSNTGDKGPWSDIESAFIP
jgi:hypothetical protein